MSRWSLRLIIENVAQGGCSLDDEIQLMLGEDASPVFSPPPPPQALCVTHVLKRK